MSLQELILNVQQNLSRPKALDVVFSYIDEKITNNIVELNEELWELGIHHIETYMLVGILTVTFEYKAVLPARQELFNDIKELLINVRMKTDKDLEGLQ